MFDEGLDRKRCRIVIPPGRPGGDLLSHTLRCSTIGAKGFNGPSSGWDRVVRRFAMSHRVTKSAQYETNNDL